MGSSLRIYSVQIVEYIAYAGGFDQERALAGNVRTLTVANPFLYADKSNHRRTQTIG